jgi:DNA replication licensing factor MCM5
LLFGGTRKRLQDGTRLRGDVNVLLIGDPSTAKSQFLKFVARVAPIAVYTSGKGSSAAGLTASVIRDNTTREFQLEGGAMVLADGGVVCIDEFDKMKPDDRVAIHEAMEQQTISVAKAGITTILNSRTSVLAAANPIHGSYDDLKQAQEQIDLQTTILSRFDCIFLVRDIRNEETDRAMASHVVNLHMGNTIALEEQGEIDINDLRKYIAFARSKCAPKLQEDSMKLLQNFYVSDRKKQANGAFPITVRQLEAIIRLSESLAKMSLSAIVTTAHVEEAHRLFEVSTLNASSAGLSASGVSVPREMAELVQKIEEAIRRKVAIGTKIQKSRLEQELLTIFSDYRSVEMALVNMIKRDEFQQRDGWRLLIRMR